MVSAIIQVESDSPIIGKKIQELLDFYNVHICNLITPKSSGPDNSEFPRRKPFLTEIIKANDYIEVKGEYKQIRIFCMDALNIDKKVNNS